jgi:DNA-binding MarR family transcriptional regulator
MVVNSFKRLNPQVYIIRKNPILGVVVVAFGPSQRKLIAILSDGKPRSLRMLVKESRLSPKAVESVLRRLWFKGSVLRSEKPNKQHQVTLRGRKGLKRNLRSYFLYVLCSKGEKSLVINGVRFVTYNKYQNSLQKTGKSKAQLILDFFRDNDRAFYSREVVEKLSDKGVHPYDVMPNVRRFEKKGLVYVRGYRTGDRETPFKNGYITTWIDQNKPRDEALEEAVERTNKLLEKNPFETSLISRVHLVRDLIVSSTKTKDLVSSAFIKSRIGGSEAKAEKALKRALQLFPDLKEIKLFNAYRHFYHTSMPPETLNAAITMKENYIRKVKGRANRIGHNWEACAEWFIDKFHEGAKFRTQKHRSQKMDPRRITIHLLKSVGRRRRNAEVDRVWEVSQGLFADSVTYVLECKWGLVRKEDFDDFLEVLKWSKEFGFDSKDGRQIQQGVIGVFAGKSFNPRENVHYSNGKQISLAQYAARMRIQFVKAADFNKHLRTKGVLKSTSVQKICKLSRNEKEVRETLDRIWEEPSNSEKLLTKIAHKNQKLYDFEKKLEMQK